MPFRQRLSKISVPLLRPDPDVVVDLQALLNRCYDIGGYDRFLNYDEGPPSPPLSPDDLVWVRDVLKARTQPQSASPAT